MNICRSCSAYNCERMGDRCSNGFITGAYPTGIPNCQKEEVTNIYVMPPYQWEALSNGVVKGNTEQ